MSGFTVDLDTLGSAATAMRASLSVVGDWDARKQALASAADWAGHPTMRDAIGQFCDEWSYGFGHLAEDIEGLASTLEQAASVYSDTEEAIVESTSGGHG